MKFMQFFSDIYQTDTIINVGNYIFKGNYMFSSNFYKYFLSLFFVATFSFVAVAQEAEEEVVASEEVSESSDEDVEDVGRVTVTGSRIKRTDIEGASPLLVITRDDIDNAGFNTCLLYTSPSPRDRQKSRMPSSA